MPAGLSWTLTGGEVWLMATRLWPSFAAEPAKSPPPPKTPPVDPSGSQEPPTGGEVKFARAFAIGLQTCSVFKLLHPKHSGCGEKRSVLRLSVARLTCELARIARCLNCCPPSSGCGAKRSVLSRSTCELLLVGVQVVFWSTRMACAFLDLSCMHVQVSLT